MRVLIVEDEPLMAEAIRDGLRLEAIAADIAGDGDSALELLSVNDYDIAVLDRDIPGPSGDEIARRIVASGSGMGILMLTAADRLDDKTACDWIRSAARSTATAAMWHAPANSSPCSKCSSPPKAESSAPKSS
jgi:CheY-like chemotaxis protein